MDISKINYMILIFIQAITFKMTLPLQNTYLFVFLIQFISFFLYHEGLYIYVYIQAILVFIPYFDKENGTIDEFIK
jgi:hypothetical protein